MKGKKIFDSAGLQLSMVHELESDETYYLSEVLLLKLIFEIE